MTRPIMQAPAASNHRDTLEGMSAALRHNIQLLEERRRKDAAAASRSERIAHAVTRFTGSMTFVYIHLCIYSAWILFNLGIVPGTQPFDPTFVILAMEASVEAIFLATFVLISQNRMAAAADRRADLDLHISLLTEHELTKVADLLSRIADRLEIPQQDPEFEEIKRDVEPAQVLDALDAKRED